jgi:excisionase family DNA binding protein
MVMANTYISAQLGLQQAIDFIGQHYIAGWTGEELAAQALPLVEEIKKYLSTLKQDCEKHSLDYKAFANVRIAIGKNKRTIKVFDKPVKSLGETFSQYKYALSRYDFTERFPRQYKEDYASYKRQIDALALFKAAINTGLCDALFINATTGETKSIHPVLVEKSVAPFNILDDSVLYSGDNGFLSVSESSLHKAITEQSQKTKIITHKVIKTKSAVTITGNKEYFKEKEVAELLGLSCATLSRWRVEENNKLPFMKFGRSVRYLKADVDAYAAKNKQQSTSDKKH